MIGYVGGSGWLHRAHPFASFLVAVALVIQAVFVPAPVGPVVLLGLAITLPLTSRAYPAVRAALGLSVPLWFFLLVIHGAINDDPLRAVTLGSRLSAILFGFTTVVTTAHPARITEALVRAGAPFSVAYLFSATLQAIPRLKERARVILEAQQCRGLSLRGSVVARVRNLVPLAVPLVLGALAEVDERAIALETRGAAAGRRRTPLDPPEWRPGDSLLVGVSMLLAAAAVTWWWAR